MGGRRDPVRKVQEDTVHPGTIYTDGISCHKQDRVILTDIKVTMQEGDGGQDVGQF